MSKQAGTIYVSMTSQKASIPQYSPQYSLVYAHFSRLCTNYTIKNYPIIEIGFASKCHVSFKFVQAFLSDLPTLLTHYAVKVVMTLLFIEVKQVSTVQISIFLQLYFYQTITYEVPSINLNISEVSLR